MIDRRSYLGDQPIVRKARALSATKAGESPRAEAHTSPRNLCPRLAEQHRSVLSLLSTACSKIHGLTGAVIQ